MAFVDVKYEGDDEDVYIVRMDADLQSAITANAEPAGAITKPWHLATSPGRRNFGINPRNVVATRTLGTAPDIRTKRVVVTVLQPSHIKGDPPPINIGDTFTYAGNTWTVASVNGETER